MRKDFGKNTWMYPLPVLIIGTYDEDGKPNAMNAAWGGIYDTNQVMLCLSVTHKTAKNINLRKAFTVSFATASHVAACDYVGLASGNNTPDKMEKAGFTTERSQFVDAPVINELPMALECTLNHINEDGIIVGDIVNVSADESILGENGKIDPEKLQPIAFDPVNNGYLVLGRRVGNAFSDGKALK